MEETAKNLEKEAKVFVSHLFRAWMRSAPNIMLTWAEVAYAGVSYTVNTHRIIFELPPDQDQDHDQDQTMIRAFTLHTRAPTLDRNNSKYCYYFSRTHQEDRATLFLCIKNYREAVQKLHIWLHEGSFQFDLVFTPYGDPYFFASFDNVRRLQCIAMS